MLARRIGLGVAAWVVAATSLVVFVTRPERCPTVTPTNVAHAAAAAASWYDTNQHDDGSWIYRYNRATKTDLGNYHYTRHSGVLLALYLFGDIATADRGTGYALQRLHSDLGGAAFGDGRTLDTGASALLVTALGQRRLDTGDPKYDKELADLGHFLVGMVGADGKVFANWIPATQSRVGTLSFSTGELWFALSRLERLFPDSGWRGPAERVARYTMQHRDDAENIFPPTSDHWGAYALDEMQHWATPPSPDLTVTTDAYATRLAGLFGVQVRFESQRTNQGVNLLLRGHQALPSGLGTLGEGLGALARYETARGRPDEAVPIRERMGCAVGMLVARQDTSADPHAKGAWFDSNITQMDYQQHALETLVAYG